jgi:hypothetical protein
MARTGRPAATSTTASPLHATMVANMAGTTRRMRMPATTPIAKATSAQAENATPCRSNVVAASGLRPVFPPIFGP